MKAVSCTTAQMPLMSLFVTVVVLGANRGAVGVDDNRGDDRDENMSKLFKLDTHTHIAILREHAVIFQ